MVTTWAGAMPTALRIARSRTFSRVVSSTVLKTPATAMAVRISASPAITVFSNRKDVSSLEFSMTSADSPSGAWFPRLRA